MANFRTKARALDLLGRQQIAGIPTAINELLKNAHDAYADRVDIDYFRTKDLFILRDDGIGMSLEDFESRWLTLGTESKVQHEKALEPRVDPKKQYRVPMGEKGIGRLAIASIGAQVLIISKAKYSQGITVALVNWALFEVPGLYLEDVVIPIRKLDHFPEKSDIDSMIKELNIQIDYLLDNGSLSDFEYENIKKIIYSSNFCPKKINQSLVNEFSFKENDDGGTFFYVSSVDKILNKDIDGEPESKEATKIEKLLMGFHNKMTPGHPKPLLDIVFRDYKSNDENYQDIIKDNLFFTEKDFDLADHQIEGEFDEYGQFKGFVKIYREEPVEHIINWSGNSFNKTKCGPFSIKFAYLQGREKESLLKGIEYTNVKEKADKFGGIYIYRDNIRILPYGDSDYDYLEIEKRRNKRFSAFFSYRRMFGVINISQMENEYLKEKAGREGFIENLAYRQVKEILKSFFTQLAADFFSTSEDSPRAEAWRAKREELTASHEALERRNKLATTRKNNFEKSLTDFFENKTDGVIKESVNKILVKISQDINSITEVDDQDQVSQKLIDMDLSSRKTLSDYIKSVSIAAPRGFHVRGELKRDYESYLDELELLEEKCFKPAFSQIDEMMDEAISSLSVVVSKRRRLEKSVEYTSSQAKALNSEKRKLVNESVNEISTRVKSLTKELMIDLDNQIRETKDKFKLVSIADEEDLNLFALRNALSNEINEISERNTKILDTIIRQIEGIYWEKGSNNNYITNEDITNALGDELDELKSKLNTDIELSQLGLAVNVIHHEFSGTIRAIRSSIKDLKAWSEINEHLDGVYKNIKINFEHLDGYLNLFTPLNRRLTRRQEDIKLPELKSFLIDLFGNRLDRHDIQLKHTKAFTKGVLKGYRSSFYPVFVNIIDNAIYWLNKSGVEDKIIRLHAEPDGSITVSNNGTPIKLQDKNRIFELGFSRKENGRGMGLAISNEVLYSAGYQLNLVEPRKDSNVTFKIYKLAEENDTI
jgi:signal transduction histidine kinase